MLEAKRQGTKITQKDLAAAADVGQTAIHKIIRGETQAPHPQILIAIADVFTEKLGRKITLDDLIEKDRPDAASIQNVDLGSYRTLDTKDYVWLPLYGEIPCGDLRQVGEEQIIDHLPLPKWLVGPAQFVLRADGDSMAPTIEDGDLLLIEPGNRWDNNDIVIAYVDGEVTCKRLQINNNHALLIPDNRAHKAIVVEKDIFLIGRVIGRYEAFVKGWRP